MAQHCCDMMRSNVENTCEKHSDRYDCPDCLVDFWENSNRYVLMIHDGGAGGISINYCPWCGTKLPTPIE
jgi:hypothetical protein